MQQHIKMNDVPEIEGVIFQGFQGEIDYSAVVNILKLTDEFDQIKQVTTLEDIQLSCSHLTNCDPYQDMLFAEADGEPPLPERTRNGRGRLGSGYSKSYRCLSPLRRYGL